MREASSRRLRHPHPDATNRPGLPRAGRGRVEGNMHAFLCVYVIEVTAGPEETKQILRIAEHVLKPGGLALIQMKYYTSDGRTRGRPGVNSDGRSHAASG
jgi:hypothetical protein